MSSKDGTEATVRDMQLVERSWLASGKFAIIEKSKEFTLVPWRAALERQRGKAVSGIVRGSAVSFDFSKKHGIGIG